MSQVRRSAATPFWVGSQREALGEDSPPSVKAVIRAPARAYAHADEPGPHTPDRGSNRSCASAGSFDVRGACSGSERGRQLGLLRFGCQAPMAHISRQRRRASARCVRGCAFGAVTISAPWVGHDSQNETVPVSQHRSQFPIRASQAGCVSRGPRPR